MEKHLAFVNPQKDTTEKCLPLQRNEITELANRVFERVMARLKLTATSREAIKEIEKLQRELDDFERRFR